MGDIISDLIVRGIVFISKFVKIILISAIVYYVVELLNEARGFELIKNESDYFALVTFSILWVKYLITGK